MHIYDCMIVFVVIITVCRFCVLWLFCDMHGDQNLYCILSLVGWVHGMTAAFSHKKLHLDMDWNVSCVFLVFLHDIFGHNSDSTL